MDYRNLGAEELGGVYEGLLGLTPRLGGDGARFTFAEFAGNARKTSGSYYTPDPLVQCLLDTALDPVVESAVRGKAGAEAERAILDLKVCDPAAGSGHFLVGAAHRLARHLARVRAHCGHLPAGAKELDLLAPDEIDVGFAQLPQRANSIHGETDQERVIGDFLDVRLGDHSPGHTFDKADNPVPGRTAPFGVPPMPKLDFAWHYS